MLAELILLPLNDKYHIYPLNMTQAVQGRHGQAQLTHLDCYVLCSARD